MTPLSDWSDMSEIETVPYSKNQLGKYQRCGRLTKKRVVIAVVLTVLLALVLGFLIGYFVPKTGASGRKDVHETDERVELEDEVSATKVEEEFRYFTSQPHVGGTERQDVLINHIATKWREYGFDDVETPEYQVLLSLPQEDQPNTVEVLNNGVVEYSMIGKINVTTGHESKSSFQYFPYLMYAPPGVVEGELVFCNGGMERDLQLLDSMNISVKDRIVLLRGQGGSVTAAAKRGAVGAILYVDPAIVAEEGTDSSNTYPNAPWVSKDAVFSKKLSRGNGDPLTPHLPSITGMYRRPRNESNLPSIPAQPISYEDALNLLSRLRGNEVPEPWRGALNVTYKFGPGFTTPNTTVRLRVNNKLVLKSIYNVIGTINGKDEPDRYVLVGNHRDAIFFGAADASSGSATLMEVARVLGKLKGDGWRPRRTVKLCSWGAEEFGLVGSVEWVQENAKLLTNRAVVYLNTDVAVGGNFVMVAQTCPMLTEAIFDRAKKVQDPDKSSIYDTMVKRFNHSNADYPGEPNTIPYLYYSDYLPFYMSIGVPSADFSYFFGSEKYGGPALYPVYHTQEDSYYWVKTFVDPNFAFHVTMTKFIGGLLLDFSDSLILPLDVVRYAKAVDRSFDRLEAGPAGLGFIKSNISTKFVHNAIQAFMDASNLFQAAKDKLTGNESPLVVRAINDQLVQVEKAFISPWMQLDDPMMKHVFSRDTPSWSSMQSFPGVVQAIIRAINTGNVDTIKEQLSLVAEAIISAADIIKPVV